MGEKMTEEFVAWRGRAIVTMPAILLLTWPIDQGFARAQNSAPPPPAPASGSQAATPLAAAAGDSIPPGTTITMQNWQQFQQYMPDGMVALFEGKHFWKMPADVKMEVGPSIVHPLPKTYM